jgi:hypothetical protein
LNELNQGRDYGHCQQDVNKTTQSVRSDNSQKPQNKQNSQDCPKHKDPPFRSSRSQDYGWQVQAILSLYSSAIHASVQYGSPTRSKLHIQLAADERRHAARIKKYKLKTESRIETCRQSSLPNISL